MKRAALLISDNKVCRVLEEEFLSDSFVSDVDIPSGDGVISGSDTSSIINNRFRS